MSRRKRCCAPWGKTCNCRHSYRMSPYGKLHQECDTQQVQNNGSARQQAARDIRSQLEPDNGDWDVWRMEWEDENSDDLGEAFELARKYL